MGPFTRQDATDLAAGLVAGAVWFGLVNALPQRDTPVGAAAGLVVLVFLMTALNRVPAPLLRRLGGYRERRRAGSALRTGLVPDDTDREAWLDYLAVLPNTALFRRRRTWLLVASGAGLLAGLAAAGASRAFGFSSPGAVAEPFLVTAGSALIGIGVCQLILPWTTARTFATMRRTLQKSS